MTKILKGNTATEFDKIRLETFIAEVAQTDNKEYMDSLIRSVENMDEVSAESITQLAINNALANVDEAEPDWIFTAAKIKLADLYNQARKNRGYGKDKRYGSYYELTKTLVKKGIYSSHIYNKYSKKELDEISQIIDPDRDYLFNYPGLSSLAERYLATDHAKNVYELPQERWLTIALYLMQDEPRDKRLDLVKESYWALSNMYMTVATPTLANSGLAHGQLSSCFIDTVDDSLYGIYDTNTDIATLSKSGGGIGIYLGKVRSLGSSIRGYKGLSSGVVPWIKQYNNTAVSVDQLGTRKGAVAVYLDVWHKDVLAFLDLRLNNGDERLRAHDVFTGLTIPDLFMETVEERGDWHLFDPHEVREVMGFSLEDFYDEKKGSGSFRDKYQECVDNEELSRTTIPAIDIVKRFLKSQLESGTPFMFYRDEVNRKNPNKHEGMIYSSNLCTEITQNMSATQKLPDTVDEVNGIIKKEYKSGDFVVCNLSSISLARAVRDDVMERLIDIQVRMLDNVIDINNIEVQQANLTAQKYRNIGLGTFGWHHLLALEGIQWESQEAVDFADELYEKINFLTISASNKLSKEKGAYPVFKGSDWHTGKYFEDREYSTETSEYDWDELKASVAEHGLRNGSLIAVAPNGSTSIINGSTASIDPIFKPFFMDEKKDSRLPNVAPDLDHNTYNVYRRSAYIVDQFWSVKQNAARQRHIDQSQSFNIYVPNTIRASVLLDVHLSAWRSGVKTTYYVRSTASDIEDCTWCES